MFKSLDTNEDADFWNLLWFYDIVDCTA